MSWQLGAARVNELLTGGNLDYVQGISADGGPLLASAAGLLQSATREANVNPEAAYVLAYDAARKACAALLAQQGLRTKASGHHVTTEEVVRAQFGGPFDAFGALRRRRAEIEYPRHPRGIRRGATWQIGMDGQDFAGRARFSRVIDVFGRFHDKNVRTHEMSNGTANR